MKPPTFRFHVFIGALTLLIASLTATAEVQSGSMDVHWDEGASDCSKHSQPPLQVHSYNSQTFILRENLCLTFEAPFMYLLIGSKKALFIDTGDVADPNRMPLAKTVMSLLPGDGSAKLPLLVVHTHRHGDHRAGDSQFTNLANVQVVGFDIDNIRRYYNFTAWPNGAAELDLGERVLDAIPTPGHNETEVSFYDRNTGLFFAGDFIMPARLLVDDLDAYLASAKRVAAFAQDRPVSFILGGHIEMDTQGRLFDWQSQYHPHEHVLQLTKQDLLALPAALERFNGFYTQSGQFVMINSIHLLSALAAGSGIVIVTLAAILVRYIRGRRRRRTLQAESS